MTIEELLDCHPDDIKKMTDTELLKHFEPYLKVTRPELAEKPAGGTKRVSNERMSSPKNDKFNKAMAMAAQLGIDLDL